MPSIAFPFADFISFDDVGAVDGFLILRDVLMANSLVGSAVNLVERDLACRFGRRKQGNAEGNQGNLNLSGPNMGAPWTVPLFWIFYQTLGFRCEAGGCHAKRNWGVKLLLRSMGHPSRETQLQNQSPQVRLAQAMRTLRLALPT